MKRNVLLVLLSASLLLVSATKSVSATPPVGQWWEEVIDSPELIGGSADLKRVYAACNGTHLFLLAEFYDSIPNEPKYIHAVSFYLDTDRNDGTGSFVYGALGAEYQVWASSSGDATKDSKLFGWNFVTHSWDELSNTVEVVFEVEGDYVGGAVALGALGLHIGDTFDLAVRSYVEGFDSFTDPIAYTVGEHSVAINPDGYASDWTQATKKFSDPASDLLSIFDFTDLYVTDSGGALFFRFDFATPPSVTTLPQGAAFYYTMQFSFDTDQDSGTGGDIGFVSGAEYIIRADAGIVSWGKFVAIGLWKWSGTDWQDVSETVICYAGWQDIIEYSMPLSGLSIGSGSSVNMYLFDVGGQFDKYPPVTPSASYTIAVDETDPSISDVNFSPTSPSPDQAVTVTAAVTDAQSGLKTVEIMYSTDGGATWTSAPMTGGSTYTGTIPKQAGGTTVTFKVKAEDYMGNTAESTVHTYNVKATILGLDPIIFYALVGGSVIAVGTIVFLQVAKRKPQAAQKPIPAATNCPNCGAALKPEAEFCPSCGKKAR